MTLKYRLTKPTFDKLVPEGEYKIEAESLDEVEMESTAELTHLRRRQLIYKSINKLFYKE